MLGTAELVSLAIQTGIKLARTGRKVYLEDSISRELVIPLPAGFTSAIATAREHAEFLHREYPDYYRSVFQETHEADHDPSNPIRQKHASQELIQLYLLDLSKGMVPELRKEGSEIAGIAALKQWAEGEEPFPDPLQRVGGALVEIAIDYFANVPGAINDDSKYGKSIKALLKGLDQFNFQEARWDSIVIALFIAGLEVLGDHPEFMSGDDDRRELISNLVNGVATDIQARLKALPEKGDLDAEERIRSVGTTLLRSFLRNGGYILTENPRVLGLEDKAQQSFFRETFSAFMELLTAETGPGDEFQLGAALRRVASTEGMDRLITAVLKAGTEHPQFFRIPDQNLEQWLQKVLKDLYENHKDGRTFFDTDLFPEIASLVIDHGLQDLPKLINISPGAQATTVSVARELYDLLVDEPVAGKGGRWKLDLSRTDVIGIFEYALSAIATSPSWFIEVPENQRKTAKLVRLGIKVLMDLGEGGFKQLLRSGHLEALLSGILVSGIIEELETVDENKLAQFLGELLRAIESHGVTGLDQVLESGAFRDLLVAVAESDVLDKMLGGGTDAQEKIEVLLSILDQLRAGTVLTVPDMTKSLRDAA